MGFKRVLFKPDFLTDKSGATVIEYGLLVGLLAIGVLSIVSTVGISMGDLFLTVSNELDTSTTE